MSSLLRHSKLREFGQHMLCPDAALEATHSRACDDCVELTQPSLQSVESHTLEQLIAARFEAVDVIRRNALTLWEKCINLLQQSR